MRLVPTRAKTVVALAVAGIGALPPYNTLRLVLVESLGTPLRPVLGQFHGLFYRDKPYFNVVGSLLVSGFYAVVLYLVWSSVQRRKGEVGPSHTAGGT